MNSRNKKDAYAARYKNANSSKRTKIPYVAPIVRNLTDQSGIRDYQSAAQTPTKYLDQYGNAGLPSGYTNWLLCQNHPLDRPQCLSIVTQGTDNQQRTGNRITCKSLNVSLCIQTSKIQSTSQEEVVLRDPGNAGNPPAPGKSAATVEGVNRKGSAVRVIIFIDATPAGSTCLAQDLLNPAPQFIGAPADVLNEQLFGSINVNSLLNSKSTTRFKVLCNEILHLNGYEQNQLCWQKYISLEGLAITYNTNDQNPTCINTNGIYMYVLGMMPDFYTLDPQEITESINLLPGYTYTAKLRFVP